MWTDQGLTFVDEAAGSGKPFYLYMAYNAPHWPLQAPPAEIARFRHGVYAQGRDKLRAARYARQVAMGIVDPKWGLSDRDPQVKAWDTLSPEQREVYDQIVSIYAAVIAHLDAQIGRLVDDLKRRGLYDNTVILFMSDNGASSEGRDGRDFPAMLGGHAHAYLGRSWANLGNTPYRMFKHDEFEGGTSTPLIVHWPAGIRDKGKLRNQVGHLVDVMPTVLELAGATYPKQMNGHDLLPLEGTSLVPAFADADAKLPRPRPLFWEMAGGRAVNDGHWKLVAGLNHPWELYDFNADRTERPATDQAAAHPDVVRALADQ